MEKWEEYQKRNMEEVLAGRKKDQDLSRRSL